MNDTDHKRQFEDWTRRHKGLLIKVVRAYAYDAPDQQDLLQEIAIQLWDSIPRFRGDASERTWIYRVALYTAMTWARRESKHRTGRESFTADEHALSVGGHQEDRRVTWLYRQIAQLNEIDRSLVLLHLDGFSYREIAEVIGISESNVGVKLNRIKKRLAEKTGEIDQNGV
jgi:RNA polymerase sigma-70 factor (ECF subfamily)